MPHLSGVFDEFPDLDKVSVEEIAKDLSFKPEIHLLVNYLGNRIAYPQVIPLTPQEMELDLAILRVGVKLRPGLFFQPQTNKIFIPKKFEERFPNLELLLKTIIEGVNPKGVHFIYIKDQTQTSLIGSVVSPINPQKMSEDEKTVTFTGLAIIKSLNLGEISFVPTPAKSAKIKLGSQEFDIAGGRVGIIVDLRLGGFG